MPLFVAVPYCLDVDIVVAMLTFSALKYQVKTRLTHMHDQRSPFTTIEI